MTKGEDLAFPQLHTEQGYDGNLIDANLKGGLSKREYFAALAMQGCLSRGSLGTPKEFAETSVDIADALIAELNKKENEG